MVEFAFDCPISTFEFQHALCLQLIDAQTAYQINHFPTPLTVTFNPCFQPPCALRSRKLNLAGRDIGDLDGPDLKSGTIVFPFELCVLFVGQRGKKPVL